MDYIQLITNLNQILKLNTRTKLIEVNDKLQVNELGVKDNQIDLSNLTSKHLTSNIHSNFSKIELQCVDYSNKNNTKGASINIDPCEIKTLSALYFSKINTYSRNNNLLPLAAQLIRIAAGVLNKLMPQSNLLEHLKSSSNTLDQYIKEEQDKNLFFSCEKINPYTKDEAGYSPVSKMTIRYEPGLRLKWKVNIETGVGIVENTQTGGTCVKKESYKKGNSIDILLNEMQMAKILKVTSDYIERWEVCNMSKFINNRNKVKEYLIGKIKEQEQT